MGPLQEGWWWSGAAGIAIALCVLVLLVRLSDWFMVPLAVVHCSCFTRAEWCFLVKAQGRGHR